MHEVLVNRLGGLSLPRKSVFRLTDRPDMTLDVYRGRKTTIQQQQQYKESLVGWYFGFNGPLRQYFSLYLPKRGRKRRKDISIIHLQVSAPEHNCALSIKNNTIKSQNIGTVLSQQTLQAQIRLLT